MNTRQYLTFDDVLLLPNKSNVLPAEVDVSTKLTRKLHLAVPFISSAMDTVTESSMAVAMSAMGGCGVIHRNLEPALQAAQTEEAKRKGASIVGCAVGPGADLMERLKLLLFAGADFIVLDTAHGHSQNVLNAVKRIKDSYPDTQLVAGNVATPEATVDLILAGADAVKVGIGPGSICTTRIVSGVGVPQITAVYDCAMEARKRGVPVIADGGIRHSGDAVKALAAGASCVMLGKLLSGCEEAPGEVHESTVLGRVKTYRGMGSIGAMSQGSKDRYGQAGVANDKLVPEGVEGWVPVSGTVADAISQMVGGLRSGMGYVGADTVAELSELARFIQITPAGLAESHVHGLAGFQEASNYGGKK